MSFEPEDLRLAGADDEDGRSWLVFRVACGDAGACDLRVFEPSVRLVGLDEDLDALRRAVADRLNELADLRGVEAVTDLLCADGGRMQLMLWPREMR